MFLRHPPVVYRVFLQCSVGEETGVLPGGGHVCLIEDSAEGAPYLALSNVEVASAPNEHAVATK